MNLPALRLKSLSPPSRILIALALCISLATGTFAFASESKTGDSYIKYSTSNTRSKPVSLNGATVSGNVYIFLGDKSINSAMYFLDTNGNYDNSKSITSMKSYPQDFQYRYADNTPKPYNTKLLKDGKHVLVVRTRNASTSKYVLHTSIFTVKNTNVSTPVTTAVQPTVKPPVTLAPTTVAPTTTKPTSNFTASFAGDVRPGYIRWGSASSSMATGVLTLENRFGTELGNRAGLHRRFFGWDLKGPVSQARTDLAVGRVPWVSIKPGDSWQAYGDGKYDAQLKQLFTDLSSLKGPVWFTFHHEPEGGCNKSCAANGMDDIGGPTQWLRMQERTSKVLHDLRAQGVATNVSFAPILMGWTFQSASGRNPSQWYKPGIWDFAGIDAYSDAKKTNLTSPMIDENGLNAARKFYGERGLKIAIGEWGVRNQSNLDRDAGKVPTAQEQQLSAARIQGFYDDILKSSTDGKGTQIIGASYFDSDYNSDSGGWKLDYLQLPKFKELIAKPTSIKSNQN